MNTKALTLSEFCTAYRIPKSTLYALWRVGRGPEFYRLGRRKFISAAAAEKWCRKLAPAPRRPRKANDAERPLRKTTRSGSFSGPTKAADRKRLDHRAVNPSPRDSSAPRAGVRIKSRAASADATAVRVTKSPPASRRTTRRNPPQPSKPPAQKDGDGERRETPPERVAPPPRRRGGGSTTAAKPLPVRGVKREPGDPITATQAKAAIHRTRGSSATSRSRYPTRITDLPTGSTGLVRDRIDRRCNRRL
ncbi:MAG TPA: hypothetical protein VKS60_09885 [Stellaceae bacterium]|nr:hypothetical protein [Stellaceae bacterium]